MHKKISVRLLLIVVFLGLNVMVLFGWAVDYASSYRGERLGAARGAILNVVRFPTLVHRAFAELFDASPLLMPNPFPGLDGFRLNGRVQAGAASDDGYLLESAYDSKRNGSTVKLIRIHDARTMHEWKPDITQLAARQSTVSSFFDSSQLVPRRYRILHPRLMDDGGLMFSDEGPMYRIDACARPVLVVNGIFHHAKQTDGDGNIWTSSIMEPAAVDPRTFLTVRDDAIARISPAGQILWKKSVARILLDNGYRGLLLGARDYNSDLVHLNAVTPALHTTKYWQQGDLLLSLRSISTVLIYRPSTDKIIWLKTGPWLKQHDPQFVGDSRISIFGNDVIDSPTQRATTFPDGGNNVYLYDFKDDTVSTPYTDVLRRAHVQTVTEGRVAILPNGDAVLEESNRGRVLRISPKEVIWQYTATAPNKQISIGAWSSYLTKEQAERLLATLQKTACP